MKEIEPRQVAQHDEDSRVTDIMEKDPQGWSLQPVSDHELSYIEAMGERGVWDPIVTGRAMARLQEQLEPESRVVIVVENFLSLQVL